MNKAYMLLIAALLLLVGTSCQPKAEKLLLGGSGWNKIVIIDKETKAIEWEHPMEAGWECNSVAATTDGNILFSYAKGAKLITKDHKELWNIPAPEGAEMQTAAILADGNFLLAWCGHPATIMEVSPKGEMLKKVEYETGVEAPHAQFRHVSKAANGNYLMPIFATSDVREISPEGTLVKTIALEGTPFCIVPLANGNSLAACGDAHSYVELDANGAIVRKVSGTDIEGTSLYFVAELLPLADGSLYVCNWQGHGGDAAAGTFPQLIEVDKTGKMIWSLNDNAAFGMISAICPVK
ncbi:MAG: hypothetical protein RR382_06425 [Tannerellaceae bacterium]